VIPAAQRDEARPRDHALPPPRYRRLGWWLAAGLAAGAAAALFAAWAAGAFGGRAAADGPFTGAASVGLATVTRGTLASQVRQNGTLRANPQTDRQQARTTAHIQSRFHRYQNSNRLDRRRRPPGRQRRGLC